MNDLRQRLMGMPLDAITYTHAIKRIETDLAAGLGGAVLTPNLDILRQFRQSAELQAAMEQIEVLVADGVPLVWASSIQGTPIPARITGTDMLYGATELVARLGKKLFIAGGKPDQGPRAAKKLRSLYPGLEAQAHPCFITPGPLEPQITELAAALEDSQPAIVLIALPFAAQIGVVAAMRERLPKTWFIGIGSSCDFVNGDRPRAPLWLQHAGLEWAHRVAHEPKMARRYLVDGLPFAGKLGAHVVRVRLGRSTHRAPDLRRETG